MFLGIDVGGSKLAAGLVAEDGTITGRTREAVDQSDDFSAVRQLQRIIAEYGDGAEGIGVCVPGIADSRKNTVWAPNIRGWNHIPLRDYLTQSSLPLVIESDRNAAVLGEVLYGAAKGRKDVIFLIIGTGIGAGIMAGGRLLRGSNEIAGAVGWIPVCIKGERRHFEDISAGPGIENEALDYFHQAASLPELAHLARHGNRAVLDIFQRSGEAVGFVLSMLVSIFNPELIIIGGGVSACWDLLSDAALQEMRLWSQPVAVTQVEVVVSRLGEDAGILGAAAVARFSRSL
jgi:glucokinase